MSYSIFIFIYNTLLTMLYAVAATMFAASFIRHKKAVDGWIAILFTAFIVNANIINMTEMIHEFSRFYDEFSLSSNIARTIILAVYFMCFGNIFKLALGTGITKLDKALYLIYIVVLIVMPLTPTSRFTLWFYYTLTQIALAYVLVRFYRVHAASGFTSGKFGRLIKTMVYIEAVFIALITAEDSVVIFLFDNISDNAEINQRNFSEDVMSVYLTCVALFYYFNRKSEQKNLPHSMDTNIGKDISGKLDIFIKDYKITPRETEVLRLLIDGRSNQQISDELFISLGTVKNHIHNIYQKCDVAKRGQLLEVINKI